MAALQVIPLADADDRFWLMMWYQYPHMPLMQLRAGVVRHVSDDRRHIGLRSTAYLTGTMAAEGGLPLAVDVALTPAEGGAATTRIQVDIEHGLPDNLAQDVGPLSVEWHLQRILKENFRVRPPPACAPRAVPCRVVLCVGLVRGTRARAAA